MHCNLLWRTASAKCINVNVLGEDKLESCHFKGLGPVTNCCTQFSDSVASCTISHVFKTPCQVKNSTAFKDPCLLSHTTPSAELHLDVFWMQKWVLCVSKESVECCRCPRLKVPKYNCLCPTNCQHFFDYIFLAVLQYWIFSKSVHSSAKPACQRKDSCLYIWFNSSLIQHKVPLPDTVLFMCLLLRMCHYLLSAMNVLQEMRRIQDALRRLFILRRAGMRNVLYNECHQAHTKRQGIHCK